MYVPPAFREDDPDILRALIAQARLALLVSNGEGGTPDLTPLPLLLDGDVLIGHLARANPHAVALRGAGRARAVFLGVEAYVSPAFYPAKQEHGRVVPTWNYEVITAEGPVEILDDHEALRAFVTRLTDHHEAPRPDPWAVTDAPPAFTDAQLKGIVGLRLTVERLTGKRKLSQNRSAADVAGVVAGLSASLDPRDQAAAAAMSRPARIPANPETSA
ncbi:FMN-binding negative transcriptional regulator [Roseomonas sp. CCTCC AB2023176]|uniref:FMN-binding negative transcriptional regulator n=1 Tax=Roseomonas sp. CCTCC AB2023176 TaxID=3342640 RepID=UPI0035D71348